MRLLFFALVLALKINAQEVDTVIFWGKALPVPVPKGYTVLDLEKPAIAQVVAHDFPVAATNTRLALFFRTEDLEMDDAKGPPRTYDLQYFNQPMDLTAENFADETELAKTSLDKIVKETAAKSAELIEKSGEGKDTVNAQIPLPVFYSSARAFANSMLWKINTPALDGSTQVMEHAVTVMTLHVNGGVLFLYVRGPKSALVWTQKEAVRLGEEIIKITKP